MSKNKKTIIHNGIGILIALGIILHLYSIVAGIVLLLIWLILFFIIGATRAPAKGQDVAEFLLLVAVLIVIKQISHSPDMTLLSGMIMLSALNIFNMWKNKNSKAQSK